MEKVSRLACLTLLGFILSQAEAAPLSWKASGKGGAVAAGGEAAAVAGLEILRSGGNAADAAAATLLALAVTDYGWFAIGGEVPFLIYDAQKGEVKVLCGLGAAPRSQKAIDWFYANGIPATGSMKAAPVPGALHLIFTAIEIYGTKSFVEVVAPTLKLLDAEGGPDWHANLAVTFRRLVDAERSHKGSREEKLVAARDRFYKGDIADELEAWYIAGGAFLRKSDLEAHTTLIEDPVSVQYRGYTVNKCGPWTQGPVLCQTLSILAGFDLRAMGHLSADHVHVVVEALKLAFADRDTYYGDPRFVSVAMDALLSQRYATMRRQLIDLSSASGERRAGDPHGPNALRSNENAKRSTRQIPVKDTTTCVVADRWGNVVAATPSCNLLSNEPGPLGVTQGNRVRSLNTTRGHPNRVQPGKRPRITLTPTLVTRDGKPIIAISVAGGDLQDQTTLNVLLNHVDFGLSPAQSVTAPRFNTSHHENSFDPNPNRAEAFVAPRSLRVNKGVRADVQEQLRQRGHRLSTTRGTIAHPVMLYIDPTTKIIHAAGDPQAHRHAGALD